MNFFSLGAAAETTRIALFGGSSSATTYLPEADTHHARLEASLAEAYPGQPVKVYNFADNGEFMARYLLKGRYEKDRASLKEAGMDIAIFRFGINDRKRFGKLEFERQLKAFIAIIKKDFPGVQIVLENGFYVDYPAHYYFDRNKQLNPYWAIARKVAEELQLPFSDVYAASEAATKAGNWDLRIRTQSDDPRFAKRPTKIYYGTDLDAEYGNDPMWFADIHPNPRGVQLAVDTEVAVLKTLYPEKLPSGARSSIRAARSTQEWEAFFGTTLDLLELPYKRKNPDKLQQATKQ